MFEKFGEFDSYEEINLAAKELKEKGDKEYLLELAGENGFDEEDANDYFNGVTDMFTTFKTASMGKIEIEEKALELPGNIVISDWVGQIKTYIMRDDDICRAVRKKGKRLVDCLGAILKEAYENQWDIPNEIKKAAGFSGGRVSLGEPTAAGVNEIIKRYYLEGVDSEKE